MITFPTRPTAVIALLTLLLLPTPTWAEEFTLDLRDTDIQEFIQTVGKMTGKTIIVDPRVKGRVNIQSPKTVSAAEFYEIFLVQLAVSGYSVVDIGNNILKVIPQQAAKLEGIGVQGTGSEAPLSGEEIITRVVKVNNVEVSQLVPILRPLVDNQSGIIAPYPASNVILITDKKSNVRRLLEIIGQVDKADTDSMEVIRLNNGSAKEMSRILMSLIRDQAKGHDSLRSMPIITADERSNSLLIRGDHQSRQYLKGIISKLDSKVENRSNTKVVYLKYAKAAEMATLLENMSNSLIQNEQSANAEQSPNAQKLNLYIQAHEETNAVVLSGTPEIITQLEGIIAQLDIRRAQVLVEALIVEITESRSKELGVQWLFTNNNDVGGAINFNSTAGGITNLASTGDNELLNALGNLQGAGVGLGRIASSGISFATLINAFAQDSDSKILSTPVLMTMDNEEASIHVGQEVPIITGSTASDDNSNPYQTFERKDVGIKLSVVPQINEGDSVQLKIQQEVSSLTGLSASDIITNKRVIDTTVMIQDGATIVLGGLVDDDLQEVASKIPGLGDIPGLGRAFRSDATERQRRNLMVFIRPTIVRDNESMSAISSSKYLYIKAHKLLSADKHIKLFGEEARFSAIPEWTGLGPSTNNLLLPATDQQAP